MDWRAGVEAPPRGTTLGKATTEKLKGPLTPTARGVRFGPPPSMSPVPHVEEKSKQVGAERCRRERPKVKIDPRLMTAARELRDRYLEQANDHLRIAPRGKYDVGRSLEVAHPAMPRLAG